MAQAEIIIADEALLPEAIDVYNEVFRPKQDLNFFKRRLLGHYNTLILIARVGDRPVGMLIGYEERPGLYRHWLGAVHPEFRREGVGQQLMEAAQSWALEHGYDAIRCEATNRQREWVQFAIHNGFEIIGLRYEGDRADNMIVFEKPLSAAEE